MEIFIYLLFKLKLVLYYRVLAYNFGLLYIIKVTTMRVNNIETITISNSLLTPV